MKPNGVTGFSSVGLRMNGTEGLRVLFPMIIPANQSRAFLTIAGIKCPLPKNGALILGKKEGALQRRVADIRIADNFLPPQMFAVVSSEKDGEAPVFNLTVLAGTVTVRKGSQSVTVLQNNSLQLADGAMIEVCLSPSRITKRLEIVFHFTAPMTRQALAIEPPLAVVGSEAIGRVDITKWEAELLYVDENRSHLRQALKQAQEGDMAVIGFFNREILNLNEDDLYELTNDNLFRPILDLLTCKKLAELAKDEATADDDGTDNPLDLIMIKLLEMAENGDFSAKETLDKNFLEICKEHNDYYNHLNEYHLFKRILRVLSSDVLVGMFEAEMNYDEESLEDAWDVLIMEVLRRAKQGDQACGDFIDNDLPRKEWNNSFEHWAAFGVLEQLLNVMNPAARIEMAKAPHDDDAVNDQALEKVVERAEAKDAECLRYLNEDLLTDNWLDEDFDRFGETGLLGRIAQVVSTETLVSLSQRGLSFDDGNLIGSADAVLVSLLERAEAGDSEARIYFSSGRWKEDENDDHLQHLTALGVEKRIEKVVTTSSLL